MLVSPTLAKLLARAVCFRVGELPAGLHWPLPQPLIPCLMMLGLRSPSSQAVLRHARLPLPLRVTAHQAPRPPPGFEVPPQPSTSGWVPPGPPPPRSRRDSSASESEASEGKSVASVRDSTSARLADLIYEVCPDSRPLFDAHAPRCGFEAWFGQPEAAASKQRFRMYPRVAEVQEEVAARSEALARRAKP